MPRTTNKGIRFTAEELRHVEQLRPHLPEYSSEADLLHHAALLGTLVLATHAARPGLTPYAGYAPDDLAALLWPRLMPAIDFLIARGAMSALFTMPRSGGQSAVPAAVVPARRLDKTTIDYAAAEDLEGLGSGFMDDD